MDIPERRLRITRCLCTRPQVRLMTWCGKYLRANGGTPPWRNSITHDGPYSGATQNWVLWDVEAVEPAGDAGRVGSGSIRQYLSLMSSFSSVPEDILSAFGSEDSPKEIISRDSSSSSSSEQVTIPALYYTPISFLVLPPSYDKLPFLIIAKKIKRTVANE